MANTSCITVATEVDAKHSKKAFSGAIIGIQEVWSQHSALRLAPVLGRRPNAGLPKRAGP